MTPEQNKALVRAHYEQVTNCNNLAAIDDQLSPDFVDHEMAPGFAPGSEGVKQWLAFAHRAFPDLQVDLHEMVAEGNLVAVRATWTGTHQGPFIGIAPTGRTVSFRGIVFWRVAGNRIAERWTVLDQLSILKQLGAIPE